MTYVPIDVIVDQKERIRHKIDSLNLLSFDILLIFVLLSVIFMKRSKFHFINGTGLAIIFGLILGASIRYLGLEVNLSSEVIRRNMSSGPKDYVKIDVNQANENDTHSYIYEFKGELKAPGEMGSQISYVSIDPEIFFNILLPPIVLNASLNMRQKHVFMNLGSIFTFAFVGTTISVAVVGVTIHTMLRIFSSVFAMQHLLETFSFSNCLYFGAIISPTDPISVLAIFEEIGVDATLFALIFGESILNDAVAIVLAHSIDLFSIQSQDSVAFPVLHALCIGVMDFMRLFTVSSLVGLFYGVLTALTTKHMRLQHMPLFEASLFILISYGSFLTAEVFDASGIVAILLCGITQAQYTFVNLSHEGRQSVQQIFSIMTFLCENFLFIIVGVASWQRNHTWDVHFIAIALFAVILARICAVYPLVSILNLRRNDKIPQSFAHILTWGGAARGLISYSLAAQNTVGNSRRTIWSTTTALVLFSGIFVGGSARFMLSRFDDPVEDEREELNKSSEKSIKAVEKINPAARNCNRMLNGEHLFERSEELNSKDFFSIYVGLQKLWMDLDARFIRPALTKDQVAVCVP